MTSVAATTPTIRPICCERGVAPTRNPVFKSCEVAPALAAATQTTAPIDSATAAQACPVQPTSTNSKQVPISVVMVSPEIGLFDEPIMPTTREDTVTKKNP